MQTIYFAGGCLWGVQAFVKTLPGVVATEAGRANGAGDSLEGPYDGYAECVKTTFDEGRVTVTELMGYFFEIIDPYSVNRQGADVGEKYRTGVYSEEPSHLREAEAYIRARPDRDRIRVEVLPLARYVPSAEEHQDRLDKFPNDYCHIPRELMTKYLQKVEWLSPLVPNAAIARRISPYARSPPQTGGAAWRPGRRSRCAPASPCRRRALPRGSLPERDRLA